MDIVVDVPDKPEVARPELEVILAVGYDEVGACGLGIQLFQRGGKPHVHIWEQELRLYVALRFQREREYVVKSAVVYHLERLGDVLSAVACVLALNHGVAVEAVEAGVHKQRAHRDSHPVEHAAVLFHGYQPDYHHGKQQSHYNGDDLDKCRFGYLVLETLAQLQRSDPEDHRAYYALISGAVADDRRNGQQLGKREYSARGDKRRKAVHNAEPSPVDHYERREYRNGEESLDVAPEYRCIGAGVKHR